MLPQVQMEHLLFSNFSSYLSFYLPSNLSSDSNTNTTAEFIGNFWELVETYGNFGQLTAAFGNFWELSATFWEPMPTHGNLCKLLAIFWENTFISLISNLVQKQ